MDFFSLFYLHNNTNNQAVQFKMQLSTVVTDYALEATSRFYLHIENDM